MTSETDAAREALRTFLAPNAVAVIGASRDPGTIGAETLRDLVSTEVVKPKVVKVRTGK